MAVQMEMCFFVPLYFQLCIQDCKIGGRLSNCAIKNPPPAPFCVVNSNIYGSAFNYPNPFYDQNGQFLTKNAVLLFFIGFCQPPDRMANNKQLDIINFRAVYATNPEHKRTLRALIPKQLWYILWSVGTLSPSLLRMTRQFLNML